MSKMKCLRCGGEMRYSQRESIQFGEGTDFSHLLSGSLEVEIHFCPLCGKIEFFSPEKYGNSGFSHKGQQQTLCGNCHELFDADYPKCPWCGKECEE